VWFSSKLFYNMSEKSMEKLKGYICIIEKLKISIWMKNICLNKISTENIYLNKILGLKMRRGAWDRFPSNTFWIDQLVSLLWGQVDWKIMLNCFYLKKAKLTFSAFVHASTYNHIARAWPWGWRTPWDKAGLCEWTKREKELTKTPSCKLP